jgi:hypothetical protein
MPNQYCPNKKCTYYGGSGLIIAMQPEYFHECPYCHTALTLERPPPLERSSPSRPDDETDALVPSFVHYVPMLERSYSDVDQHLELIDVRRGSSGIEIGRAAPKAPADFTRPRHCVMDEIESQDAVTVSKGVPYHDGIRDLALFLREKMTVRGSTPALQYSAFYAESMEDRGPCKFMLGWDHALILVKRKGSWLAHSVYSAKYRPVTATAEAMVYRVTRARAPEALSNGVKMVIPGKGAEEGRTWYAFDLSKDEIPVSYVVTLGLTSCSFACLFNDDCIVLSHMSSKAIPVAWLASAVLGLDASTPLKLLASHHGDPTEFAKYTTTDGMPLADTLSIDSILCSRGVKHMPEDLGTFTPSLSHPYMGLNLTSADQVSCFSVLGYNNDPALHIEQPPLHIVWPLFFQKLKTTTDTQLVIDILSDCLAGNYGFDELYTAMFAEIVREESLFKQKAKKEFSSSLVGRFEADLKPTTAWSLRGASTVPPKAKLPDPMRGWAHVCFVMIDTVQHLDVRTGAYGAFTAALLRAWNQYQKGFNFDLARFDRIGVPAPKERAVPKYAKYLG